jgi:hypothetical protein
MGMNFTNLQIHPDALPPADFVAAGLPRPVPNGYMQTGITNYWLRFPRPSPKRMAYDFDGIVASVKAKQSTQYSRGTKGRVKATLLNAYHVVVRTEYGFSAWGLVGNPDKAPCPLNQGDKVRVKDFSPEAFRYGGGNDIVKNLLGIRLTGLITTQSRPPYYRMPILVHGRFDGMMLGIYETADGVERLRWDSREKAWYGGVGRDKTVRLAPDSPLLMDK